MFVETIERIHRARSAFVAASWYQAGEAPAALVTVEYYRATVGGRRWVSLGTYDRFGRTW